MVLLHGGGPGAEKIAASWAEKHGVHQVVCKPNWDRDGKAAPFRRNDVLLNFLPKGLVAFPGSGITNNMIDKARKIGIPVLARRRLDDTLQGRSSAITQREDRPFFYAGVHKVTAAYGGALRATANYASLRSLAARRSPNAASPLCGPICAFIPVRTDRCLLPTLWPWRLRQPFFPATRPCPETSADCAP